MRTYLVVGNWKMNGSQEQIAALLQDMLPRLQDLSKSVECVLCPASIYIPQVSQTLKLANLQSNVQIGGQNCADRAISAFTGEISASMLRDFGCNYVILGHSERRQLLKESDGDIAAKLELALEAGLKPILCVGETRQQQEAGRGYAVVSEQLRAVIDVVGAQALIQSIIAYEPVWAIGTGLSATPEQAQAMHAHIREMLHEQKANTKILYGGSVTESNAAALFAQKDIDGGLIGGASLKAQDFSEICRAAGRLAG